MNTNTYELIFNQTNYTYTHTRCPAPPNNNFVLHNHDDCYEVIIFFEGNTELHIEGSVYTPAPRDIIVLNSNEMHRMYMKSTDIYDRIVIHANYSFFCMHPSLKNVFTARRLGQGNILRVSEQHYNIIMENCKRIEYYIKTPESELTKLMIDNLMTEIMYTLNLTDYTASKPAKTSDERIKNILAYINENLTKKLTIESISKEFFINKYHLCRVFKATTGMTVNRYINCKRIILAKELHSNGKNFTDASLEAGFENYASFYSVYRRETGQSPRNDQSN